MNDQSKFARYRDRKKAAGLRELRMWVPDVHARGFQERLDRAVSAINAAADEAEIMEWSETAAAEVWNDIR